MDGGTVAGDKPGFGQCFTAHMATARFDARHGWSATEIVPFQPLSLSPAAMVFHYGQAVFEGLKAYRQPDGSVALFRPHEHAARLDASAARLVMPELPAGAFVAACTALVQADIGSVPSLPGHSLYLRPMLVATEQGLGVRPAAEYLFAVIASPAGSYLSTGLEPIAVWVTREHSRVGPGGTGAAKCSGNYASSLATRGECAAHACGETLWLDAVEQRWIEELSGMNVVLVADGDVGPTLVSPPVGGTILDGVTRRSLLELGRGLGYGVVERPVALEEMCDSSSFVEAFACGTAAGVVPIVAVRSAWGEWSIGPPECGPVTRRLHHALVELQEGRAKDPSGWRVAVAQTSGARQR